MGVTPDQPRALVCGRGDVKPFLYKLEIELDGLSVLKIEPGFDWLMFVAYSRGRMERYRSSAFYSKYRALREQAEMEVAR